ncbi:MAG: GDSL-type esterase/lipase family protein [Reyranella sp.]|nr:GDSL-type esterase/lipase family protein [Reyranella sp.]
MRICFVGDSIVNGTGDPEYLGWVGRVLRDERTRRAELTGYNLGIRRDTSAQVGARWNEEVTRRLPAEFAGRVVFSFGVNDCVQEVTPADSLANCEAILGEAKARWPVFMVGLAPIVSSEARKRAVHLDGAFFELCAGLAVPYLSVFDALMATPLWLDEAGAGDGAHPGAGGYGRLAEIVLASPAWRRWMAP